MTFHNAGLHGRCVFRLPVGVVFVSLLVAVGCREHSEPLPVANESAESLGALRLTIEDDEAGSAWPIVVHDRLGRGVRLTRHPVRIVSLTPSLTELMYAIGAGEQLVGATAYCNYPPEATEVPRVSGGTLESVSREQLLDAKPDLVLCQWDNHEPLIEMLEDFGIPALALGPETLDGLYQEIYILGRVTGHEASARRLVSELTGRVNSASAVVGAIPIESRRSVFYEVWDDPLMTAGPDSFIGEILELAGTRNIFADTVTRYPRVSAEAVVVRNPDVILAPSTHDTQVSREDILRRQGWSHISAVKNEQVFLIDGDQVSRCGPRLVDALEEVIRVVYPEQYKSLRLERQRKSIGDTHH